MLELHIRELLGNLDDIVAIAEAGGEDQLVAGLGQLAQHAFGIRTFRHVLDDGRLRHGVAQRVLHELGADGVAVIPAIVVGRADQHEADLERLGLREGLGAEQRQSRGGGADLEDIAAGDCHLSLLNDFSWLIEKRLGAPQLLGRNGLPRQAGALVEASRRIEISTSTTTVAR
jgi:hypothetical protein